MIGFQETMGKKVAVSGPVRRSARAHASSIAVDAAMSQVWSIPLS